MLDALKLMNMEKVWKSLSKAKEIPGLRKNPPLRQLTNRSVWITAKLGTFRAHLKALAFTQPELWDARVISDLDIVETWLKTAKAQGHKIYDSETANHNSEFIAMDITELVSSIELVILKLGVKQAPNKETHSTLLEALSIRRHLGMPTWIVDTPDQRIDNMAHKAYSEVLEGILSHWPHIGLVGSRARILGGPQEEKEPEVVSDMDMDELLVPTKAEAAIDDALSDLDEEDEDEEVADDDDDDDDDDEEDLSHLEDDEDEADLEDEEVFEEEEEDEDDEEVSPMVAAMMANEEKAEEKTKKKRYSKNSKRPFKGWKR